MNIDKKIRRSTSQSILWSINEFYDVTDILRQADIQISYWEGEDNWGELIISKQITGYIWHKYPIIFVTEEYFDVVNRF